MLTQQVHFIVDREHRAILELPFVCFATDYILASEYESTEGPYNGWGQCKLAVSFHLPGFVCHEKGNKLNCSRL